MKKLRFTQLIAAQPARVFQTLIGNDTYPQWAGAFHEGSYAVTDWQPGSRVHFLTPEGRGMYSDIVRRTDGEEITFRHLGEMKEGQEQPPVGEESGWMGAEESYRMRAVAGGTELTALVDTLEDWAGYMEEKFPKALARLKELAEA